MAIIELRYKKGVKWRRVSNELDLDKDYLTKIKQEVISEISKIIFIKDTIITEKVQ